MRVTLGGSLAYASDGDIQFPKGSVWPKRFVSHATRYIKQRGSIAGVPWCAKLSRYTMS